MVHGMATRALVCAAILAVSACDAPTGPEATSAGIAFGEASLRVVEHTPEWDTIPITRVEAAVEGVNVTGDTLTIAFPNCVPDLVAYDDPGSRSAPAWRLRAAGSWPGGLPGGFCFDVRTEVLAPGDTLRLDAGPVPLAEILADSLPAGSYIFQLNVEAEVTGGGVDGPLSRSVDLGAIDLPVSSHPLQMGYYPRDGFTYGVEILAGEGPDEPDVLRFTITRNDSRNALTRELLLACPVRVLAYRTAEERVRIPVSGPAWTWPRALGCDGETMPLRLEPGGSARFEYPLPPERYAVDGLTIRDYVFTAIVEADGRPLRFAVDPS